MDRSRGECSTGCHQSNRINDQSFTNEYGELLHLASGTISPREVGKDTKTMLQEGETAAVHIIGAEQKIHSTLKKTKLRTFSVVGNVTSKSNKGELVAMKNSKLSSLKCF